MTPRNLAEARAECIARKLGPSACMDLISPFCGAGENAAADLDVDNGLAFCKREASLSPAQTRVLLNEAQERQEELRGPPWLLIGGGVAVGALVLYLVLR